MVFQQASPLQSQVRKCGLNLLISTVLYRERNSVCQHVLNHFIRPRMSPSALSVLGVQERMWQAAAEIKKRLRLHQKWRDGDDVIRIVWKSLVRRRRLKLMPDGSGGCNFLKKKSQSTWAKGQAQTTTHSVHVLRHLTSQGRDKRLLWTIPAPGPAKLFEVGFEFGARSKSKRDGGIEVGEVASTRMLVAIQIYSPRHNSRMTWDLVLV